MPALAAEAPGRLERSPPCAPGRGLLSRLGSSSKSVCEELHLARTSGPWPRVLERRSSQGSFPQESVCPSRCSTSGTGGVSIPQVLKRRLRLRVLEHFRLVFPSTSLKSRGSAARAHKCTAGQAVCRSIFGFRHWARHRAAVVSTSNSASSAADCGTAGASNYASNHPGKFVPATFSVSRW